MSMMKILPLAALAGFGYANSETLTKAFDVIGKVQVEATSSIEMQNIARTVAMEYVESNTIPLENFSEWLKQNMREASGQSARDRSRDMWGTPYRIARSGRNGFEIQCAGPDKTWGTTDDIKLAHSLDQYGGVGEAGVTQVIVPQTPASAPSTAGGSQTSQATPTTATAVAPASPTPPSPEPPKQAYQWKRG